MKIVGNIICHNGLPDLLRTIESMYPTTDEIYVVDGGSDDGTWEWLNNVKDVYNLKLYQNKFESILKQRNWLLEKTPRNAWVLALDQDEALTPIAQRQLRVMLEGLDKEEVKKCNGKIIYAVHLHMYNLIRDTEHHSADMRVTMGSKLFYNQPTAVWQNEYHSIPTIKKNIGKNEYQYTATAHQAVGIKHYAFLDKRRMAERKKRFKNKDDNEYRQWFVVEHNIERLPEELL